MTKFHTKSPSTSSRRWATVVAAAGLLALLGGCVVYPAGGYYAPHPYWHGGYWR